MGGLTPDTGALIAYERGEPRIREILATGIKPEWAVEAFPDLDEDVRQSIARIKASPFIPNKNSVRGFVYHVENGHLHEIDAADGNGSSSIGGRLAGALGLGS